MRYQTVILTVSVLMLCLPAASCTSPLPPDWPVAELTLPWGARNVVIADKQSMEMPEIPLLPVGGGDMETWGVSFEHKGGWSKVDAHVKKCMDKAGFESGMPFVGNMMDSIPGMGESAMYHSSDNKLMVMLMGDVGLADEGDALTFELTVSRMP